MSVSALGYLVIDSAQTEQWEAFCTSVLGAALSDHEKDDIRFRVDDHPYRLLIREAERDQLHAVGWQVRDAQAFEALESALKANRVDFERTSSAEAFSRRVGGLLRLEDPSGNRLELFHSPLRANSRFVSPVGVSGFVTGDMGLGHVVLPAPAFDETADFYTRVLGFALTDRMRLGAGPEGDGGMRLQFYHCNPRHHSLALMEAPHPAGLVHLMLEVESVDEVGIALDRCLAAKAPISATLGRHSNDKMFSFYVKSPSGFDIEVGCQGIRLDVGNVVTSEITSVSDWGHDFSGMGG